MNNHSLRNADDNSYQASQVTINTCWLTRG